jgi:hypothetical protein
MITASGWMKAVSWMLGARSPMAYRAIVILSAGGSVVVPDTIMGHNARAARA